MTRPIEGETKPCPQCGNIATYSEQARVPGSGAGSLPEDPSVDGPEYQPGWYCSSDCGWVDFLSVAQTTRN
jgi:hypothetical protein